MGVELAVGTAMALQAGSGIASGIAANRAGKETQKQLKAQAALTVKESKREAGRLRLQHKISNAGLKLQFLHQGVGLAGSPENILASGMNLQDEEARAIVDRGETESQFLQLQGKNARSAGRAALISGVISGVSSAATTGIIAKSGGLLDKKPFTPKGIPGRFEIDTRPIAPDPIGRNRFIA